MSFLENELYNSNVSLKICDVNSGQCSGPIAPGSTSTTITISEPNPEVSISPTDTTSNMAASWWIKLKNIGRNYQLNQNSATNINTVQSEDLITITLQGGNSDWELIIKNQELITAPGKKEVVDKVTKQPTNVTIGDN
jgi:hypothetical protein